MAVLYAYRLGSMVTDNLTGLKSLGASATVGTRASFQSPMGTEYIVPIGKTFYITKCQVSSSGIHHTFSLGYFSAITWHALTTRLENGPNKWNDIDLFIAIPGSTTLRNSKPAFENFSSNVSDIHVTIYGIEA